MKSSVLHYQGQGPRIQACRRHMVHALERVDLATQRLAACLQSGNNAAILEAFDQWELAAAKLDLACQEYRDHLSTSLSAHRSMSD